MLRATTACTFSTSQLPKVVRSWCVLYILTSKCASRHNGVHFFISHLASWLRTRRFSEPTFRPSGAPNHWKNTVNRDFPTFSRICIFFLLILSLLTLLTSAFQLSILSEVSLLNFLRSCNFFISSLVSKHFGPTTIVITIFSSSNFYAYFHHPRQRYCQNMTDALVLSFRMPWGEALRPPLPSPPAPVLVITITSSTTRRTPTPSAEAATSPSSPSLSLSSSASSLPIRILQHQNCRKMLQMPFRIVSAGPTLCLSCPIHFILSAMS